jgi:HEAT repeat protein
MGAGLLGLLWGLGGTMTQGAEPTARPTARRLATPVRFDDLIRLLDDPRPAIRLEAINFLETLNRPASDTVPALRRRFDDPVLLVRVHAVRVAIRAGLPTQQAVPVAVQLLIPGRPDVCCPAAQILGGAGPAARAALPQLHACFKAASVWVRLDAAQAALKIDATDLKALNTLRSVQESEQGDAREYAARAVEDCVSGLTLQLRHADPRVRRTAAIRLERLGTAAASATGALVGRFSDPDLLVRAHAARAALRLGAPPQQILEVASELLIPDRLEVLRVATSILVEIGPDAADALPKLDVCLNAFSLAVRLHAAEAILRIDPNDLFALDELQSALDHQQTEVRFFSVNALGAAVMDNDEAVCALQRALSDPQPKVATAAALHLLRANEVARRSLPEELRPTSSDIAKLVSELSNTTVDARRTAAIRLTIAGPTARQAVPALIDHLGDRDPVVRLHVAQAIWEIDRNSYPILPVLLDLLLTDRAATRIGAIYTISRMGPAAADCDPWLTRLLKVSKSFDRLILAQAIARLDPTRHAALEVLVRGLRGPNADVRYLSTVALGAVPLSPQAVVEQPLRVALADRNFHVRCSAHEALGHLQERIAIAQAAKPAPLGTVVPAAATVNPSR